MLQNEYKSVYFVCRKPKFTHAVEHSENGIDESIDFLLDEEENEVEISSTDFGGDNDDRDVEDTN